ncbi:MAG: DUF58 domain-containing protein, partial [Armatimonadetes bacterium]|nr:DUF58 domain-containing protein [Armatimonadota bacterium]
MRGGGGGWMGPERTLGGMSRSFGLQRQWEGGGPDRQPIKLERASLRRVVRYLLPYWRQWLVILACVGLAAGLGVLPPLLVRSILDRAIPRGEVSLLTALVSGMVLLNILLGLVGVLQNYLTSRVGQNIMVDLRNELYRHVQRMSLRFYTTTRAGEIISRINNDVGAVQGVVMGTMITIVSNLLTVTATLIAIFSLNARLALLAMVVVPTFYLPTRLVGRVRQRLSRLTQERQADVLAFMQERLHIGGMLLTKGFGQGEADAHEFETRTREVADLQVKQAMAGRWLFMCLNVFSVAGPAMIYWYGGYQAIHAGLSVGTIIAVVAYLTNLYRPIGSLANIYVDIQGALAVFERIFEYLDLTPEVVDLPGAMVLSQAEGRIEFEEVREYADGDDPRSVDWNVSARMGRPFVKKYKDERERTVVFLVDLSASMTGGFGIWSARQTAARVVACLALSAARNGDKTALVAFGEDVVSHVRPRKGPAHALRIIR